MNKNHLVKYNNNKIKKNGEFNICFDLGTNNSAFATYKQGIYYKYGTFVKIIDEVEYHIEYIKNRVRLWPLRKPWLIKLHFYADSGGNVITIAKLNVLKGIIIGKIDTLLKSKNLEIYLYNENKVFKNSLTDIKVPENIDGNKTKKEVKKRITKYKVEKKLKKEIESQDVLDALQLLFYIKNSV